MPADPASSCPSGCSHVCKAYLVALRKVEWVVYAKRPFGRPEAVLAYLSRYTHRIAIANSRLVAFDGERVTFVRQFHNRGNGAMATGKFVSYLRVSTDRQGRSGLGF